MKNTLSNAFQKSSPRTLLARLMYANECAEVRRLVSLVMSSQLALEKACLRLNTVGTISDVLSSISPMMEVVSETGRRLKGIVPSVTGKLQQVDTVLKASLSDMGTTIDPTLGNQGSAEVSWQKLTRLRKTL